MAKHTFKTKKRKTGVTARRKRKKRLEQNLTDICREIVYLRDGGCCQKCGKPVEGCNAHTSHVIPKSRGKLLRWNLLNLFLLCFHDHIDWWHKSPIEAGEWFKEKYPARYGYLMVSAHKTKQWTLEELEELYELHKQKLKELSNGN